MLCQHRSSLIEHRYRDPMRTDGTGLPRTDQITEDICAAIRSGTLKVGEQLPSYRALAVRYKVSASTIQRVIFRLEALGVLRGSQGKGVFVARIPD